MGVFYFIGYLFHMKYIISENQYNLLFKELLSESMGRSGLLYQKFSKLVDIMKKYIANRIYNFEIVGTLDFNMFMPIMSLEEFEKVFIPYLGVEKISRETHPDMFKTQYTPEGYPLLLKVPSHTNPFPVDIKTVESGIYTNKFDGNGNLISLNVTYWESKNDRWQSETINLTKPFDIFSYFLNKRRYVDGYEVLVLLATQYGTDPFGKNVESLGHDLVKLYNNTQNTGDELSWDDVTGRDDIESDEPWKYCWDEDFEDDDGNIRTMRKCEYKLPNSKRIKRASHIVNENEEQDYTKRVYSSVLGYIDANSDKIRFNQDNVKNLQSKGNVMRYCESMRDGKTPTIKLTLEEIKVLKSIMTTLKTMEKNSLDNYVERGQNIKHDSSPLTK